MKWIKVYTSPFHPKWYTIYYKEKVGGQALFSRAILADSARKQKLIEAKRD